MGVALEEQKRDGVNKSSWCFSSLICRCFVAFLVAHPRRFA
jgi:hypothetical protein